MSIRLETERLVLRLPRLEDADAAAGHLGDPEVMRFLGGETVPREHVRAVVRRWLDQWDQNGVGKFVLERRSDRVFVGRVGLNLYDPQTWTWVLGGEGQPELGWTVAREHWGHGYATEAAHAVRDWARCERGIERLISLIAPTNLRSQRVAEKLGATPTETVTLFDSSEAVVWVHPQ
jgi:RimJ/RimL family protein N-acetyltransferase